MRLNLKKEGYVLLAIFVLNLIFKLILIGRSSLWYDEIISVQDTLLDFGHLKHESEWDKNPPFYFYVVWIWSKMFGISEIGVRSLSAFFSAITAVMIYLFSRNFSSVKKSLAIVLLFSAHPFLFYYSQEARCFSLLIFLVLADLMQLYALIQSPSYLKAFVLGVFNFLIFYTHYLAGLILLCQFLFCLFVFKRQIIYHLLIFATPVLLCLIRFTKKQWLVLFFSQEMAREKNNAPISDLYYLKVALSHLFESYLLAIVYLALVIYFVYRFFQNKIVLTNVQEQFKLFVVSSPIVCVTLLYLVGRLTNVFHERYLIYVLPYFIIALNFVFFSRAIYVSFFAVFICVGLFQFEFGKSRRMDYRLAANLVRHIQKEEKINVIIQTHDVVNLFTYYYDRDIFLSKDKMNEDFLAAHDIYYIESFNEFKEIKFRESRPFIFFQTFQKKKDEEEIDSYLKNQDYATYTSRTQIEGIRLTFAKPKFK